MANEVLIAAPIIKFWGITNIAIIKDKIIAIIEFLKWTQPFPDSVNVRPTEPVMTLMNWPINNNINTEVSTM